MNGNDNRGPSVDEAQRRFTCAYAVMLFTPGFGMLAGHPAHRLALITWQLSKTTDCVTLLDAMDAAACVNEVARGMGIDLDPAITACDAAAIELKAAIRAALAAAGKC